MLKAIALKELRLEEGFFPKGAEFAPGYTHNVDGSPYERILYIHPPHRAEQLRQTKDIMLLDEEYSKEDELKHNTLLEQLNEERRFLYNGIFQPIQHVSDPVHDSSADPEQSNDSGC